MNGAHALAYYADDPTRSYQLIQWLEVLEVLDAQQPVALVVRDPDVAAILRDRTRLSIFLAPTFSELTELYAALEAKVVLYCNNSALNFQSLVNGEMLHVHINHGESDKQSMASNNAKAYDRVFVAGEAAVQRHLSGLLEFDPARLVRVGRPQLDLRPAPVIEPTTRRTVLYAPTWEGDADYNDYTSVDTIGPEIVRSVLAVPDVRVVYKPHPKVTTSLTPAIQSGHLAILEMIAEAAAREPEAGHTTVLTGNILAVMPDCDAMVTDVSSVGLDWLYLCTDKPILITDRHCDPARFRDEVPVSHCADVVDESNVDDLASLLTARLAQDSHHFERHAMRHFYFDDLQVGDSTTRFLEAVAELVRRRDRLVHAKAHGDAITA
ncbi:CDP-glycerol glycerophosphotransferase family protein [Nocardioides piscis]|uniref:CDP-glycerol--glycerophosphate glycerophosphotransferase n=1 Tax=Nocardioides piscis TaxID=2714938 RepID=A0A6G7YEC3_9ACTN|nr:CDP-glycerol glycerophosphotransferase family protein [Nocardioides piscis]QIK75143.1 CDP-glycerol--glycerophosphate glycerophosphotransferase [Nocardioides piscis]